MEIYAGNLSANTTEDDLRRAFSAHGTVHSCRLATDRDTHRPKGFAVVEMHRDEEASAAISALNGTELGGSTIMVNVSNPRKNTAPRA